MLENVRGFDTVTKHLLKLSPSFSPEVRICLRSHIKLMHLCFTNPNTLNFRARTLRHPVFQLPFAVF